MEVRNNGATFSSRFSRISKAHGLKSLKEKATYLQYLYTQINEDIINGRMRESVFFIR